ncbi:hypothetical protein KJ564_10415, partial [bacterium]|nr:hypothetical protein [bacterium]
DCVADCMKTSQSYHDNYYGWSWYSDVDNGFSGYVEMFSPFYASSVSNITWSNLSWNLFCSEIDANHPMVFLVDTDGNGGTDHFVTVIGYARMVSGVTMLANLNRSFRPRVLPFKAKRRRWSSLSLRRFPLWSSFKTRFSSRR